MNNLGILTNGQEQAPSQQSVGSLGNPAGTIDFITESTTRTSEIVSHADTILDLAFVDYKHNDSVAMPLLVSCSRDSTVKVWRC